MRHLSVPKKETAYWREELSRLDFLEKSHGIHDLNDFRGIPLNDKCPSDFSTQYEIIHLEPIVSGPKKWVERLPEDLYQLHKDDWPSSFDQIGEIIVIKLSDVIAKHAKIIGQTLLKHFSNIRLVCEDKGVKGDYRERDLEVIASRNSNFSFNTTVRENGKTMQLDPSSVYYSPRLATERQKLANLVKKLSKKLGKKLSICDPYAGIGPNIVNAYDKMYVDQILANDLNPKATPYLKRNLPSFSEIYCADARRLATSLSKKYDMIFVNLPHDSISHLSSLCPYLAHSQETMIVGWALSDSGVHDLTQQINEQFKQDAIINLRIDEVKSYSPSQSIYSFTIQLNLSP